MVANNCRWPGRRKYLAQFHALSAKVTEQFPCKTEAQVGVHRLCNNAVGARGSIGKPDGLVIDFGPPRVVDQNEADN